MSSKKTNTNADPELLKGGSRQYTSEYGTTAAFDDDQAFKAKNKTPQPQKDKP